MKLASAGIARAFKALGLRRGNIVMLHSALSSLGPVEGGAAAVIAALRAAVGESGTILMPFPSVRPAIARQFVAQEGVSASGHPTHEVFAQGPLAREMLAGHCQAPTACGKGTPFGELVARGGYILLLGVDQDRNTTLHTAEDYADLPYLSDRETVFTGPGGEKSVRVLKRFPGPHRNFIAMDPLFRSRGIMRTGRVGRAVARLIAAGPMVDLCLERLGEDPAAFLCVNPACADCLAQRGRIRATRLKEECFTLIASPGSADSDLRRALALLQAEGIACLEMSSLDGRPLHGHGAVRLDEAARVISGEGFSVGAVNATDLDACRDEAAFSRALELAARFRSRHLVIAAPPAGEASAGEESAPGRAAASLRERLAARALAAGRARVVLLLENRPGTIAADSPVLGDLLRGIAPATLRLAFNPANFARAGEKPFLGVAPGVRRLSGLFYIEDALFSGPGRLPGEGNAEIKEIISIVRCGGFEGFFCLRPGAEPGPVPFRAAAAAFRSMLDSM